MEDAVVEQAVRAAEQAIISEEVASAQARPAAPLRSMSKCNILLRLLLPIQFISLSLRPCRLLIPAPRPLAAAPPSTTRRRVCGVMRWQPPPSLRRRRR
jgi:hypothetical protein